MTRTLSTALTVGILAAITATLPASAGERCTTEPKTKWISMDDAKAKAVALGYTVSKVKEEDSCWEVYARDAQGAKFELFFNPVSGDLMRKKAD